jgi:hypothetical protein
MSTTTPIRSRAAGAALLLGPLVLGIAATLTPPSGDDGRSLVRTVTQHPGRWSAGWSVVLVGAALLLAGLAHLASLLPERARVATFGVGLFGIGAVGYAALAGSELVVVPLVGDGGPGAIAAVDNISKSSELGVVFAMYLPGTLIGGLLLFGGLALSSIVPRWAGGLGCLAVLLGFFAGRAFPGSELMWGLLLSAALLPAVAPARRLSGVPSRVGGAAHRRLTESAATTGQATG